jgi:hypothetical protein
MNTSHRTSFHAICDAFTSVGNDRVGHRVLLVFELIIGSAEVFAGQAIREIRGGSGYCATTLPPEI